MIVVCARSTRVTVEEAAEYRLYTFGEGLTVGAEYFEVDDKLQK
jgi:hypothetical protein